MTLEDAIKGLSKNNIDGINNWYSWREINENLLPEGITLPKGNQYVKNVALKQQLNKKWARSTSNKERKLLTKYYISIWGGIHGNSDETINRYTSFTPDNLIAMGGAGIASWSKALCVRDSNQYAIFDARVSASLNALQIINDTSNKVLFPVLTSRNNTIKKGIRLFKNEANKSGWATAAECTFYRKYLNYLTKVTSSLDKKLCATACTIEMLLFAKAEALVCEAFPNEIF